VTIETEAWALVPGHGDATRVRQAAGIKALPPQNMPAVPYAATEPDAEAAVIQDVRRLLHAGETVPADIGQRVLDARQADALARIRSKALDVVVRTVVDRVVQPRNIDRALDYLRDRLDTIGTAVQTLTEADGVAALTTAEDAIQADAVDAWRSLGHLAEQYAEVRRVQRALYSVALRGGTHPFKTDEFERSALFTDAINWHPSWTVRRTAYVRTEVGSGPLQQAVRDYQAWLRSDLRDSDVLNGTATPEFRIILAFTEHTPWVPTIAQWHAVDELLMSATTTPEPASIVNVEAARQDALRILGVDHDLPEPTRLPFAERDMQRQHKNVAGLSVDQLRDVQEAKRSQQQAIDALLESRREQSGLPAN
jgi:hypothetical protein